MNVLKNLTLLFAFILVLQSAFGQTEVDSLLLKQPQKSTSEQSRISQVLFSGILIQSPENERVWYVPNAFEQFPANTVEGFVFNPQLKFTQNLEGNKFISVTPNLRYGFGNGRFQAKVKSLFYFNPNVMATLELSGGRGIEQLYQESTLSAFNNTIYTFLLNENYLKIYERTFFEVAGTIAPVNDFLLSTRVSWNQRNPLSNLSVYEEDEEFTSNNPDNIELPATRFEENTAVVLDVSLRWQIGNRLEKRRGELVSVGKYPAISIDYSGAFGDATNSDINYHKIALKVEDEFSLGESRGRLFFEMGDFISKDELTFIDFNHFKGKQTVYGEYGVDQFQLLDYYHFSTTNFFLQGHYQHQFSSLKETGKSRFQPIIGLNYLYTESGGSYGEIGVGMAQILDIWRIDFYTGLREGGDSSVGVRLGVNFN